MGIFGWSYPPGVTGVPGDEEYPCEVCRQLPSDCVCPDCEFCGVAGDPDCYATSLEARHGLIRSPEQLASHAQGMAYMAEDNRRWELMTERESDPLPTT